MLFIFIFPETMKGLRYFGLHSNQIDMMLIIICILSSYLILRPITRMLLKWRAQTLVNYLLSSLIILILMLIWGYTGHPIQQIRMALLSLGGFGGVLVVLRILGKIWGKV